MFFNRKFFRCSHRLSIVFVSYSSLPFWMFQADLIVMIVSASIPEDALGRLSGRLGSWVSLSCEHKSLADVLPSKRPEVNKAIILVAHLPYCGRRSVAGERYLTPRLHANLRGPDCAFMRRCIKSCELLPLFGSSPNVPGTHHQAQRSSRPEPAFKGCSSTAVTILISHCLSRGG
jgi:hypothetical protein